MLEQALVTTDNSKKYTEWPNYQTQASDRTEPYHDSSKSSSVATATASSIQQYRVKESNKQASQARLRGLAQYTRKQSTHAQRRPMQTQTESYGLSSEGRGDDTTRSELDSFGQPSHSIPKNNNGDDKLTEQRIGGARSGDRSHLEPPPPPDPLHAVSSHLHRDVPRVRGIVEQDLDNNAKNMLFSQKILSRAENLLSKVKKSTSSIPNKGEAGGGKPSSTSTARNEINSHFPTFVANSDQLSAHLKNTLVSDIFPRSGSGRGSRGGDGGGDMAMGVRGDELEWLMRGVPEAYDDDVVIADEVVDRLIREGGAPPSQIHFPSLYATSQKTLLNLENAKMLSVTITELNVYSARFGLRKDSSYLVIRCPAGCTVEAGSVEDHTVVSGEDTQVVSMDLEAHDAWRQINTNRQKNVLKDYFVGSKVLDLTVKWNISMTDALIADWLSPSTNSTDPPPLSSMIHIDVYSYLLPPTAKKPSLGSASGGGNSSSSRASQKRGWSSSALLLGSTDISIQVLLASPSLSSFVSTEVSLDQTSQASVADRLRRLPNYSRLGNTSNKQQNMNTLGTMKCKLSLLDACSRPLGPATATSSSSVSPSAGAMLHQTAHPATATTATTTVASATGDSRQHTAIDEALNFMPQEVKVSHSSAGFPSSASVSKGTGEGGRGGRGSVHKAVSVGIAVHSLTRSDWSGAWLTSIPKKGILKLLVSYKIALSHERYRMFHVSYCNVM